MLTLLVVTPFAGHGKGDMITDSALVTAILAGPDKRHVLTVERPDPAPQAEPAAPEHSA